jgi:hypothetical protein
MKDCFAQYIYIYIYIYQDFWNVFDLVVVSVSLASLFFSFPGFTVLRLVRTIR